MKEKIKFLLNDKSDRLILASILFLVLFFTLSGLFYQKEEKENSNFSTDTVIPSGYVLVPIEVQNIDSLSSLVGSYGVVDLFTTNQFKQKSGQRVGRRLKLLRAPLNPQSFAVLVPENEATTILSATGPFFAVVQNPDNKIEQEFTKKKYAPQVEYFRGGK